MEEPRVPTALLLTPFSAKAAGNEKPATYRAVQRAVRDACHKAGVELRRADSIFRSGVIVDQIREAVADADLVTAVCTGTNANVFYELGMAEAMGQQPILITPATCRSTRPTAAATCTAASTSRRGTCGRVWSRRSQRPLRTAAPVAVAGQ